MATPLLAVTLVVPCNEAVPRLRVAVITVLLSVVIRLPTASTIRITGAGENAAPAVTVLGGCVCMAKLAAGPVFTVKAVLTALVKPDALAVSRLPVPAESIRKSVKLTVPLPAPLPMSSIVVPCNGPALLVMLAVTVRLAEAGVPIFVSVAGTSVEEYTRITVTVREIPGVVGIEANISCPNVERRNEVFACHPDQAAEPFWSGCCRLPFQALLRPSLP